MARSWLICFKFKLAWSLMTYNSHWGGTGRSRRNHFDKLDCWTMPHHKSTVHFYCKTKCATEVQLKFKNLMLIDIVKFHLRLWYWHGWVKFDKTGSVFEVKHGTPQAVCTYENIQREWEKSFSMQSMTFSLPAAFPQKFCGLCVKKNIECHNIKLQG